MPRNTVTVANIPHDNRKFGHSLRPQFFRVFSSPRGGHERRKILMDSDPYGYETSILPSVRLWGRAGQASKNSPRFYPEETSAQPSPGISILRDSHILLSKRSWSCPPELPHRAVDIAYFHFLHFFYKNKKNGTGLQKKLSEGATSLSEGATSCLLYLPLQAPVATITELKVRAGRIFLNCKKTNNGNPRKGDESAIQNK